MSIKGKYTHNYKEYTNAYYSIIEVITGKAHAIVRYGIWADEATYDADKLDNGVAMSPMGHINYKTVGDEFIKNFNTTEQDKLGINPIKAGYDLTKQKDDLGGTDFTSLIDA